MTPCHPFGKRKEVEGLPKINVLEKHVAELIAAGEVIERPASIVKELLENSIDAGATAVTVEIKDGGIRYLRITDNGCGIEAEDVPTAFLRHATSKVKYEYDLDSIGTLGFRGEALASVSAVARVEMLTKTAAAQFGTRIQLEGGEQIELTEAGCPDGTTIVVRDLFYNVPARLKFLKRDSYEAGLISGVVDKIALSHPSISVKLIRDNKVELHTPGDGSVMSAIYAVFGKEFSNTLLPVDYLYQGVRVTGFSSIPDQSRVNRKSQHFFVNGRYIKSRTCASALEEAYRHSIMVGKFPACVLYMEVPADTVDVNVHPTKTEIRFVNEKTAYDATYFAVKSAISDYNKNLLKENQATEQILKEVQPIPTAPKLDYPTKAREFAYTGEQTTLSSAPKSAPESKPPVIRIAGYEIQTEQEQEPILEQPRRVADPGPNYHAGSPFEEESTLPFEEEKPKYFDPAKLFAQPKQESVTPSASMVETASVIPQTASEETAEEEEASSTQEKPTPVIKLCGELFKTYILAEVENHFLIIDKHAAHERILYEKLKAAHQTAEAQMLLTPLTLTMPREDHLALLQNKETVAEYGFEVDDFGNSSVQVRSIPIFLDAADATQVLYELGAGLRKNKRDLSPDLIDDMLHSIACKAAIKANDVNGEAELMVLVKEVYQNENIRYCPHGRPVVIAMTKYELEKKFHRIV